MGQHGANMGQAQKPFGRDPTDITIPTLVGGEGSGGGAAPAAVLGTSTATSSNTGARKTTGTDSGSHGASGHGNQPPTSGDVSPPKTGTGTQPPTAHPMAGGQAEGIAGRLSGSGGSGGTGPVRALSGVALIWANR